MDRDEDKTIYKVLVNHEEQYCIVPAWQTNGTWKEAGKTGNKAECLAFVKEVWTDMTPLSLRKHKAEFEKKQAEKKAEAEKKVESAGA